MNPACIAQRVAVSVPRIPLGGWPRSVPGLTLLELIIAVAIFALVGIMAYGGLQVMLQSDAQTRIRSALLAEVQVTLAVLERDLRQIVPVGYRDRFGDRQPSLAFSPLATTRELHIVRAGGSTGQPLRRVSWRVTEDGLERILWDTLDAGAEVSSQSRVFLSASVKDANSSAVGGEQAIAFDMRFVVRTSNGVERLDAWPPLVEGISQQTLPLLIEVRLEVPRLGRIERHFALPVAEG